MSGVEIVFQLRSLMYKSHFIKTDAMDTAQYNPRPRNNHLVILSLTEASELVSLIEAV